MKKRRFVFHYILSIVFFLHTCLCFSGGELPSDERKVYGYDENLLQHRETGTVKHAVEEKKSPISEHGNGQKTEKTVLNVKDLSEQPEEKPEMFWKCSGIIKEKNRKREQERKFRAGYLRAPPHKIV